MRAVKRKRGRPSKSKAEPVEEKEIPTGKKQTNKEPLIKYEQRFEDEWAVEIWKFDKTINKNGPISVECNWKKFTPAHEKMVTKGALKKQKQKEYEEHEERVARNNGA